MKLHTAEIIDRLEHMLLVLPMVEAQHTALKAGVNEIRRLYKDLVDVREALSRHGQSSLGTMTANEAGHAAQGKF